MRMLNHSLLLLICDWCYSRAGEYNLRLELLEPLYLVQKSTHEICEGTP